MRPAELPEPDKKAPTPVTAAAALCGDNHQHSSAPALRVTAIAARMAREAAPAQGQRRGIVLVRGVQDPNAADTLALRRCAGCNARLAGLDAGGALCVTLFSGSLLKITGRRARGAGQLGVVWTRLGRSRIAFHGTRLVGCQDAPREPADDARPTSPSTVPIQKPSDEKPTRYKRNLRFDTRLTRPSG